ncbi:cytochrome P450 4C1-like [Arctopsyche grandis]|uniref:cytochrome P450 4C1-like n=1 Tax=Arctopsyche grandis TaxID=121162 RepID=UPI00406D6F24
MLIALCVIVLLLYALHNYLYNNEKAKIFNKIPGPRILPVFGNALDFFAKQVPIFYQVRGTINQFKGIFRVWIFHIPALNINNPHDIESVLSSQKHITKNRIYAFIHPWLQEGLLTSKGQKWQQRRKILTPAFHFNILKQFCTIFVEQSDRLVELLHKTKGEPVDVFPFITDFALHSICETAMGTNLGSTKGIVMQYKKAIYDIGEILVHRFIRVWLHPPAIFNLTPSGWKQSKLLKILHGFTTNVIRERRQERILSGNKFVAEDFTEEATKGLKKRLAMLDLLLSAESEGTIDEKGIREEVDTFMFEGHDTTTMAISFCLMLLANNPEAQKLAAEEINEILGESNAQVTIDDLNKMRYLERCIKEALRLYPSVPFIGREILEDLQLRDYVVPAGTSCNIHIFDLHRDPVIYPNPEKFDPDRFLPENSAKRHPFAYVPFSAGPRNCIGQKFAILEEKAVISAILRNFKLEPVTRPNDIIFSLDIVLRSRDPVKVKFVSKK